MHDRPVILSFADHRAKLKRADRLRSLRPYCGDCLDKTGEILDLVPCKRYDGPDSNYCPNCGEEYR